MTIKVKVAADQFTSKHRVVFRQEAVDDSGQPSMADPWQLLPRDQPMERYVHRGSRIVIEEYDKARHGEVKET